ncbi:cupin domain-containing protein [Pontibacter anaerobius]|uniref:Cupin domain-containing protein n=1 Tax=Pontibacter anaerobius TaxID=2993940 RepID=A0ABT3RF81_9BACT|nr:cupin domain-containing protein [Pontibacter anaerobius]MCX2740118.1 cupin domain-containing protein [Pontibacter anaerobius]
MMNFKNIPILFLIGALVFSCTKQNESTQRMNLETQGKTIFPKGEKIENNNFKGNAFLTMLVQADSINQNSVGSVTFEPGARTNWHSHPNGQIILVLDGEGYYQEKGQQKVILRKGDVVKCPADLPHWHGASAGSEFIQIAITGREKGPTVWLEPVTDEEYNRQ